MIWIKGFDNWVKDWITTWHDLRQKQQLQIEVAEFQQQQDALKTHAKAQRPNGMSSTRVSQVADFRCSMMKYDESIILYIYIYLYSNLMIKCMFFFRQFILNSLPYFWWEFCAYPQSTSTQVFAFEPSCHAVQECDQKYRNWESQRQEVEQLLGMTSWWHLVRVEKDREGSEECIRRRIVYSANFMFMNWLFTWFADICIICISSQ